MGNSLETEKPGILYDVCDTLLWLVEINDDVIMTLNSLFLLVESHLCRYISRTGPDLAFTQKSTNMIILIDKGIDILGYDDQSEQ